MDYYNIYIFVGLLAAGFLLSTLGIMVGEYGIGHFEGRRNMVFRPPRGLARKWAYTRGHRRGVKRGR